MQGRWTHLLDQRKCGNQSEGRRRRRWPNHRRRTWGSRQVSCRGRGRQRRSRLRSSMMYLRKFSLKLRQLKLQEDMLPVFRLIILQSTVKYKWMPSGTQSKQLKRFLSLRQTPSQKCKWTICFSRSQYTQCLKAKSWINRLGRLEFHQQGLIHTCSRIKFHLKVFTRMQTWPQSTDHQSVHISHQRYFEMIDHQSSHLGLLKQIGCAIQGLGLQKDHSNKSKSKSRK